MKYILLRCDERFASPVNYNLVIKRTFRKRVKGEKFAIKTKLIINTDGKMEKQWVLCEVEEIKDNNYIVKVVKV